MSCSKEFEREDLDLGLECHEVIPLTQPHWTEISGDHLFGWFHLEQCYWTQSHNDLNSFLSFK